MALRLAALGIALVGAVFWLFGGPHLGWTKTQVAVARKDPVTEIEFVEWQKNFVPGVDFLGGILVLAALVHGASFLVRPGHGGTSAGSRP